MSNSKLYKAALMDHFKRPRNKHQGDFPDNMSTGRGTNPQCGDDIQVGVKSQCDSTTIDDIGFRGRGCSVCLASASMMTETVKHAEKQDAMDLVETMEQWLANSLADESRVPESLQPLSAVKDHPARKKCVMLAWDALSEALGSEKK